MCDIENVCGNMRLAHGNTEVGGCKTKKKKIIKNSGKFEIKIGCVFWLFCARVPTDSFECTHKKNICASVCVVDMLRNFVGIQR